MDQDAFRKLLAGSRRPQPNAKQGVPTGTQRTAIIASPEPAFKPRKVKKTEGKYRDRAAERREGTGNDYAEVEAVLEDFERRVAHENKDVVEQQRKYLGGDSQHTILVKGLDMSLLEQNRARAATAAEDDDILERTFAEATSTPTELKKRAREDIIRDLKAKRQNGGKSTDQPADQQSVEDDKLALEPVKKAKKFKPIGFKPIGQTEDKPKKRKIKEGKEGVKKKQKVKNTTAQPGMKAQTVDQTSTVSQECDIGEPSSSRISEKTREPEPASLGEDFDIFVGAGDYQAFLGSEESEEEHHDMEGTGAGSMTQDTVPPAPAVGTKGWFNDTGSEVRDGIIAPEKPSPEPETIATEEEPREMHLKPLESSALPSIRNFLAMDEAAEKAEKRKARKERRKKKKKGGSDDDDD